MVNGSVIGYCPAEILLAWSRPQPPENGRTISTLSPGTERFRDGHSERRTTEPFKATATNRARGSMPRNASSSLTVVTANSSSTPVYLEPHHRTSAAMSYPTVVPKWRPLSLNRSGVNGRTASGRWPVNTKSLTASAVSGVSRIPLR